MRGHVWYLVVSIWYLVVFVVLRAPFDFALKGQAKSSLRGDDFYFIIHLSLWSICCRIGGIYGLVDDGRHQFLPLRLQVNAISGEVFEDSL